MMDDGVSRLPGCVGFFIRSLGLKKSRAICGTLATPQNRLTGPPPGFERAAPCLCSRDQKREMSHLFRLHLVVKSCAPQIFYDSQTP